MKKNNAKIRKAGKLPKIRKEIKDFLTNEEGKITEKKITKIGIILGSLAIMVHPDSAIAQTHVSSMFDTGTGGHSSHSSHASHSSHSSHSNGGGGWC